MDATRWKTIKETFSEVVDLPTSEREEILRKVEPDLRGEVEKLLSSHEKVEDFIGKPALVEQGITHDDSEDPLPGSKIGDYLVIEKVGSGGMGNVYLAERAKKDFNQKVALKIIKRGMDSEAILKRFSNERRILSTLKHPNIAQLLDGGISPDGLPYFVMEYIEGSPLNEYCRENNVSLEKRLEIFRMICSAVEHAHANLVIHRDLKSSNIIVTKDGLPKLLDFGIAKVLTDDGFDTKTATRAQMFTPEYASPEQILGKNVTTSTDVYSLGIILYELLTEHRPFKVKGKTYEEIVKSICDTEPPRPSQTGENHPVTAASENPILRIPRNELRGDLDNIVLKALRKEPAKRYASVRELSEDISRYLKGLPVLARPQTRSYRFQKYFKRHKVGVLAAGLVLLSLIGGISVASWQAVVARREQAKSEERFNQVRALSNLVIFEFDEQIKSFSGTTAAREKIIIETIEHLDRLAKESEDLPDLQRELAKAYQKVGTIQGDADYLSNLGKTKDALESFQKAAAIQKKVTESDTANSRDKYVLARMNLDVALQSGILGDWEEQRRRNMDNLPILKEAVDKSPNDSEALADLAKCYRSIANMASHGNGTFPEAVENFRKALGIYEKLTVSDPRKFSRLKVITEKNLGSALQMNGNLEEAVVFYQRAFEYDSALVKSEPGNAAAKIDLSFSYRALGGVFEEKKDFKNALEYFQKALQIREEILSKDPGDDFTRSAVARSYNHIGEIYFKSKNFSKAEDNFRKSLEIFDSQTQADPKNANKRTYLALVLANLGDVCLAEAKLNGRGRSERLWKAEMYYKRSVEIFATLEGSLSKDDKAKADETAVNLGFVTAEIN